MKLTTFSLSLAAVVVANLVLLPQFGNAQAQPISVFSFQDTSCGSWVKSASDAGERQLYLLWMRGFVSGYNAGSNDRTVTLDAMPNQETLVLYIDKYCQKNPLNPFFGAAFELVKEISQPVVKKKGRSRD